MSYFEKSKFLLLLILVFFVINVYSNEYKSKEERLSQAFGYIYGQEYSLAKIEKIYPELKGDILKSRLKFKSSFGNAQKNIELELNKVMGDYFNSYKSKIKLQLNEVLDNQSYDKEAVINFLKEVNNRAEGNIESPIKETLLSYEYINSPHKEFLNGFTKTFQSKGHPKAKGVDFQVSVPESWLQEEGNRPNVIQKFTSENGKGFESVILMVKNIPLDEDYKITDQELDELFSNDGLKEFVPEGGKYISGKPITIDRYKGGMLEFEQTLERLDLQIKMRGIHFITVIGHKMIFVQCMLGALIGEINTDDEFKKFQPLFRLIGNSIIIQDKYIGKDINRSEKNNRLENTGYESLRKNASKKLDEGIGRICVFFLLILIYIIFKTIQWFVIKTKISEDLIIKAKKNIKNLGKYALIWALIQIISSLIFITSWGVGNLIIMFIIGSLVSFLGYKLYKKESLSLKPIISIFTITATFVFVIPIIAILFLIQNENSFGLLGFLWIKFFNMIEIIRFGPAFLTLILCFYSISSMFSYLKIKNSLN